MGHVVLLLNKRDRLYDSICNVALFDYGTLYSKFDRTSDLWQQPEVGSELETLILKYVENTVSALLGNEMTVF